MSPAGYWPQLQAAIEAGADSVYFGLRHFTARAKVGFGLEELPEVMRTLHRRGARGFITFNTLIFDHELREAARTLARIAEAGADAVIVQDVGMVKLAREIAPDLELHASTQMSVTDAAGAAWAAELGVQRVTLARELSLKEIRAIAEAVPVELEVFVHGALCVAYSGQCFSSEAWGGRSANRGQCAQACRLPYELIVDDVLTPLGDKRYLLSPGDLFALHQVPELIDTGVAAMKIEGRYKDADYVAAATAAYRRAVDDAWAKRPLSITPQEERRLEQVYSRGMGAFFMTGTNHQIVVDGRAPRHRGLRMGTVAGIEGDTVIVEPAAAPGVSPLKPGDGLVFDASHWRSPQEDEEGGRVFEVEERRGGTIAVRFGRGALRLDRIRPGDWVWRTHDPAVDKALKPFLEPAGPVRKQPVRAEVRAVPGEPLTAVWRLAGGLTATVTSPEPLGEARHVGLTLEQLRDQFDRLGPTPYALEDVTAVIEGRPFVPVSLLNQLRRRAVEELQTKQSSLAVRQILDAEACVERALAGITPQSRPAEPRLHLLLRHPEQIEAALALEPDSITLDYLDLYGLKPSVERVMRSGIAVRVASPRIWKPGEERILEFLLRLECPLLIRPAGMLHALRGRATPELTGDFSLNAANAVSTRLLLEMGLARITPTHDLNAEQIAGLAREAGGAAIEAIAYQHLPVFHTEHCVFCRFMSSGTSYKDCGRPCESHKVSLQDVSGRRHPLMADAGCRNTVFGAEAQEASLHLERWLAAGIHHFRLEFVHETGSEIRRITGAFRAAFRGEISFRQLQESLAKLAPEGATQGSLFIAPGYTQLPVLQ